MVMMMKMAVMMVMMVEGYVFNPPVAGLMN